MEQPLADLVVSFIAATRAKVGNLRFEWSRSLDNLAEYVLVDVFRDDDMGAPMSTAIISRKLCGSCCRY